MNRRFRGSYTLKIDDRGRIIIPSRYRTILESQFGREVYLTSANDDHILFYPLHIWEIIEQNIGKIQLRTRKVEDFVRVTGYWGTESELDPKGRILIPPDLREKIKLKDSVLIIGQIDHIAIWNNDDFTEKYASKSFSDSEMDEISRLLNNELPLSGDE